MGYGANPDFVESQEQIDEHCACTSVLQIALTNGMDSLVYGDPTLEDMPDNYVRVTEQLLKMGADPNNNPVSEGAKHRPISTIGAFVSSAGNALKITNAEAVRYPEKA